MLIETAIFSILTADQEVVAIVGNNVFPNIIPQDTVLPAITYQQISGPRDYTSDGESGLVESRYQLNCIAETYQGAKELFEAVRLAVTAYEGTVNGIEIQRIHIEDEGDFPQVSPEAAQKVRYGKHCDLLIWYQEPIV